MSLALSVGPRVRKSPFFSSARKAGLAAASVYNHMYMPTSYGDPMAEYDRLINGVAMWDVAVERQVALKGPDAIALAKYLTPRNLDNLKVGVGKYVPLCDFNGMLINDPVLLQISEDEVWLSIADSDVKLWAAGIAGARGMDVRVYEPDVSPLAIQGPKASDVVRDLFGDWVNEIKYFGFRATELKGIPLVLARSGWSKQGGFELYLQDGSKGDALWDIVAEAGKPYGIGPGTPNYIERVESGLISYGADTDEMSNPFELGMDRLIDLDQPQDFVGKAALSDIKARGATRRFMGLIIDGEKFTSTNESRWPVEWNGANAGYVSASAYSPRLDANIAMAMVSVAAIESGDKVHVLNETGRLTAKIVSLPMV
ncbi:glycine cleavage T C-terminal barrel domain-containing protein [Candidatus Puniceispirillum marinum]|uniref:Aminomethyl transferase family protein n=1 Tax=Puniceispirillum marinum (strain IMCC1322) TaxID=488538 RepID=D5BNY1_PUNMI|nr:glycine cleavage T C-terminal barrel domain-containing protein [Candidatus Puniceispirillum marinum]ADE40415.1 aminomethyl transferase family protein [Candidatus Puniceispirillum marinum IMCC1322]